MDGLPAILLFALAVSLDGFAAGVTYGLRRIKINNSGLFTINFLSALAVFLSLAAGRLLAGMVAPAVARRTGAVLLFLLGLRTLFQSRRREKKKAAGGEGRELQLRLHFFGFIVEVFREPEKADVDLSGHLSLLEATFLGLALALDALAAGFALALSGPVPVWTPFLVGGVQFVMIKGGDIFGRRFCLKGTKGSASYLPALLLIGLGLVKWWR
ncbi:MAG: hypothetical protein PWQ31_1786 [Eubacteriales bacterium]|nr:hypothetical protein [Eubacteriales bacterium]